MTRLSKSDAHRSIRCAVFGHKLPLLFVWRDIRPDEIPFERLWWECSRCGRRSVWGFDLL